MVLELKELCLSYIAKHFDQIQNFDHSLLHAAHKEKIIERLANHNWLVPEHNDCDSDNEDHVTIQCAQAYQNKLVESFFNGHLNSLTFSECGQLDDAFLEKIAQISKIKLCFKAFKINKCPNISGELIAETIYL